MSRTICVTDDTPLEMASIPALHWPRRRAACCAIMPLALPEAIRPDRDEYTRTPTISDRCIGCHVCLNVCPVENCIPPGKTAFRTGRTAQPVTVKRHYG